MPFTLFQAGSSLQTMDTSGNLTTLTLPTGVTIDSTRTPRMTVYGRYVVVVNSPSRPITVDVENNVRVLTPLSPRTQPTLSGAAGGTLTGTYKVRQTFLILDQYRNIISESAYGPEAVPVAISGQYLQADNLDVSGDDISASRIYRTTTLGSTYFPWIDLEGNGATNILDDMADASLSLVAAPALGNPPEDLEIINEFKERLWGRSRSNIDYLRFTEAGKMYAWTSTNSILIPRLGGDMRGITGIIPRRESLIVGRQDRLFAITGSSANDFRAVKLKEGIGIESPDSIQVYRDVAYWLSKQGVFSISESGTIQSLSDGKTAAWFQTDNYFNTARFQYAVGRIDKNRNKYQLLLSSVGSTSLDRWVECDLNDNTWWGPHKTDEFTPTWITSILDANNAEIPALCSSTGFFYKEQSTRTDGIQTAIDFNVDTKWLDMQTPDIQKHFGELGLITRAQAAGNLTITPYAGDLSTTVAGTPIIADMTTDRQRLPRLGEGRLLKLNLRHTGVGQDLEIVGLEIPFFELGRR